MSELAERPGIKRIVLDKFAYIALAFVVVVFTALNPQYLSFGNLREIMMRAAITTPIALGIVLALGLRGIDLSPGTVVGLTGIIMAKMIERKYSLAEGILCGVGAALLVGIANALLVAKFNFEPMIATLAMMYVGSSIERAMTRGGLPVYLYGEKVGLGRIFRGEILGVPYPIVILLIVVFLFYFVLEKTSFGRKYYACGASLRGSMNAGIPVRWYIAGAYLVSALVAALSGVMVASQVRSGQPLVGQSYLWDAMGAAFISSFLSSRSRPNAFGALFGTFLFAAIHVGLTMAGVHYSFKNFFLGLIILAILMAASLRKS